MALEVAHGSFRWLAADGVGATYVVSGLSFQPKAILFLLCGMGSDTDAATETSSVQQGVGVATSTTSRRCVSIRELDNQATMVCSSGYRTDAIALAFGGVTVEGLLDLSAIAADGFTAIVDDQIPANRQVFWIAWGGADITVAVDGDIAEPAATGDQDYTVTGFVAAATDQVVILAGVQTADAAPAAERNDSGIFIGFATSGADADNVVMAGNADDASADADTDGYCKTAECLAMHLISGGNPNARAKLTQFGTDNFRLNWIARAVTSRRSIFLAMKGGSWKAGAYAIDGSTLNATATVSGLAFAPKGIVGIGRMTAEQAAGTATAENRFGIGVGTSTTSRRATGFWSEDAATASEINQVIEYDQVLAFPSNAGALGSAYDINAMNSDGFQIIVDVAGGVASEWQGYLAFGDAPAAGGGFGLRLAGQRNHRVRAA